MSNINKCDVCGEVFRPGDEILMRYDENPKGSVNKVSFTHSGECDIAIGWGRPLKAGLKDLSFEGRLFRNKCIKKCSFLQQLTA